jgi:hypothetical protein
MFNQRQKDFMSALNTESGRKILKYLTDEYLTRSVMTGDVNMTHYQLGRKELVEELVRTSKLTEKDLEMIQIVS